MVLSDEKPENVIKTNKRKKRFWIFFVQKIDAFFWQKAFVVFQTHTAEKTPKKRDKTKKAVENLTWESLSIVL
jgi:hypothetical protein